MSILSELKKVLEPLGMPLETGVFTETAPEKYIVLIPLSDTFDVHADNYPKVDVQEARISLFCKGSYTKKKNSIVKLLLTNDFTITDRRYIGYEPDTGYFHYNVDAAKYYELEENPCQQ